MAEGGYTVHVRVNRGRAEAYRQQARGELKRAPRRDRPALMRRWVDRIMRECVVLSLI